MTEWDAFLRIALAALLGSAIGFEREVHGKEAGLRTLTLVSLGSALFMVIGLLIVNEPGLLGPNVRLDPTRIAGEIVSGIGFLGAAIIFRRQARTQGITTAAAIWAVTGVGMSAAAGFYILAIGGTGLILAILYIVGRAEHYLGDKPHPPDEDNE